MNVWNITTIDCYSCQGQDDEQKIIFVEKKTLAANNEIVKKYQSEYSNIQAFAAQNEYRIVDMSLVSEEDYANVNIKSRYKGLLVIKNVYNRKIN